MVPTSVTYASMVFPASVEIVQETEACIEPNGEETLPQKKSSQDCEQNDEAQREQF